MVDKINIDSYDEESPSTFEREILAGNAKKKKFVKNFFNIAGIFVGVLLMFAVVVLVTVDVHLITFEEAAGLLLEFFLLLFIAYSMYITCADSGMRAGLASKAYAESLAEFNKHKKYIIDSKMQARLGEFCRHYVKEELKSSRTSTLAVVGISYEAYLEKYVGKDDGTIKGDESLSKAQMSAIIATNAIEPIVLTPDMIMKRGRGSGRRAPLGIKPETKKLLAFTFKFIYSVFITLGMSMVVLDDIAEITLAVLATCCLKLLVVVMNGFQGYKFGFENIVIDTVAYIDDQTDLMKQAIHYIEANSGEE